MLSILFLMLDCTSNEMEKSEQQQESITDPLIGVWLWLLDDPYSGNEFLISNTRLMVCILKEKTL